MPPVSVNATTSPSRMACRMSERGEGLGDGGKAMRPVVTAAGKELHVAISEERH